MKVERKILEIKNEDHFRVAIYGSSRIKKNDPIYKKILLLARMLGERGIDVVTGGGPGLMEAASRGHMEGSKKSKAHTIGLGIKLPKEQKFNKSLSRKETFTRFTERLDRFMLLSNAVVVAPGGVGTMLELFYSWQLVQVQHICNIPIILLGEQWIGMLKWLEKYPLKNKYFSRKDLDLLFLAKNPKEAMDVIDEAHGEFLKGNKDFCVNYKKYKI